MPYAPGEILLNKYRIEELIGRGAFAEVYRATHLTLDAPRALKVLRRDAPGVGSTAFGDFQARFQLEAQLGARLDHPHVIRVYDFEQDGDTLLLVMEYAAGGSLADRIARARKTGQPLAVAEAVRIAREVALGLAALHGADAVHRDVKPSNILFDSQGHARLADLGLAQTPGSPSRDTLLGSRTRPQPGTPDYMSPEQAANAPRLSPPSDVFSLGAVLFEMLTGRLYRNQPPGTRARTLRPDVPAPLDDLLARMLAEDPRDRLWDGAAAAKLLAEVEAKVKAEVKLPAPAARSRPSTSTLASTLASTSGRRRPWAWLAVAAVILMLGGWGLGQLSGPKPAATVVARVATATPAPVSTVPPPSATAAPASTTPRPTAAPPTATPRPPTATDTPPTLTATPTTTPSATAPPPIPLPPTATVARPTSTLMPTVTPPPSPTSSNMLNLTLAPGVTLELVRVPAGEFLMGSDKAVDPQADNDEGPQHRVNLPEYWIGKYEVTNAQYAAFVAAIGHRAPLRWSGGRIPAGKENHPVVDVSWDDAVAFCAWVSKTTGRVVRLPSEAEWEKAARGTDGRIYPWGNAAPDAQRANFGRSVQYTTPVGQYPAGVSPYGALDMAGNAWEWVADWYGEKYYASSPAANPMGPDTGQFRVLRGGAFDNEAQYVQCAVRHRYRPDNRYEYFGFRVASPGL